MQVRFHPQAWINDYACEVDAQGPTVFEVGDVPESVKDDSYESDEYHRHENAPQWVKDWCGPFYIEILRD